MGGPSFIVYIGRDLTNDEETALYAKYKNIDTPYLDYRESDYQIDGFNVVYDDMAEEYAICQHYIGTIDTDDVCQYLHDGVTYPPPHDARYKLRIRYTGHD